MRRDHHYLIDSHSFNTLKWWKSSALTLIHLRLISAQHVWKHFWPKTFFNWMFSNIKANNSCSGLTVTQLLSLKLIIKKLNNTSPFKHLLRLAPQWLAFMLAFSSIAFTVITTIRDYGSTVYVGMARKQNGRPYISIASDELKSLVIYTDKL